MDKLQEDTVSADRKERIIFDPEAWKNKDKSGRKTSAITSRQNFDNEKFTRNEKEKVDEGTIQPSGDSKVDSASPTQGDSISDTKVKKSNNPQIEFVSGTAQPNGSSSTAIGGARASGRKIAEAIVKKALTQVKADKNVGTEEIPFDGPYTKTPDVVVDKSGARHTAYSRVRDLARQGMKSQIKKEEVFKEEETNMSEKKTYAQFVEQLLEYTPGPGGVTRVQGKSYGANYDAGEDEDDKPAAPAAKRGRGRPAGSKSGANQKVTKGKSYGGIATHSLNLPNSNR